VHGTAGFGAWRDTDILHQAGVLAQISISTRRVSGRLLQRVTPRKSHPDDQHLGACCLCRSLLDAPVRAD